MVIGGIAAQLRNLPVPATIDIDITPARDQRNLERLSLDRLISTGPSPALGPVSGLPLPAL